MGLRRLLASINPLTDERRNHMNTWKKIPNTCNRCWKRPVTMHSWMQYTAIQKLTSKPLMIPEKAGVTVIRLKDSDIEKFKKFAPPLWVTWAKKNPLP